MTLTVEEIDELNKKLSKMRHDINNQVALIVAAAELIRLKPQLVTSMVETISSQPIKITEALSLFSAEFDRTLRISRETSRIG